jgi:hypothetical protein
LAASEAPRAIQKSRASYRAQRAPIKSKLHFFRLINCALAHKHTSKHAHSVTVLTAPRRLSLRQRVTFVFPKRFSDNFSLVGVNNLMNQEIGITPQAAFFLLMRRAARSIKIASYLFYYIDCCMPNGSAHTHIFFNSPRPPRR